MPILVASILLVVVIAGIAALLRPLFLMGGRPRERGRRLVYPLRPAALVGFIFLTIVMLGAIAMLLFGLGSQNPPAAILLSLIALFPLAMVVYGLSRTMVLDNQGLHHESWFRRPVTIAWDQFSHWEIKRMSRGGVVLFLRPKGAGKGIKVPARSFDAQDLLNRIVNHTGIREQYYQKRSWTE